MWCNIWHWYHKVSPSLLEVEKISHHLFACMESVRFTAVQNAGLSQCCECLQKHFWHNYYFIIVFLISSKMLNLLLCNAIKEQKLKKIQRRRIILWWIETIDRSIHFSSVFHFSTDVHRFWLSVLFLHSSLQWFAMVANAC